MALVDNEVSFTVKFLGQIDVDRADGLQVLNEAAGLLKMSDGTSKMKSKQQKVSLFLSLNGIDVLNHKTKFMLHSCPMSSISFCGVHQTMPNLFGFVAKSPAGDRHHCYLFQSTKFSHLLVSIIGDTFQAAKANENFGWDKDLLVEALRHKNKMLQSENVSLKKKIATLEAQAASQQSPATQ
nr:PREDICTED: PTB domain-containing engulfment adapter protein 1-like isoform X1 [Lepisosteus oculatus]